MMSPISSISQPAVAATREGRPQAAGGQTWESLSWLVPKVPLRQVICTLGAGQGPMREQFRLLRTRLEDLRQTRSLKTILVASSLPEEGRTFVALNLAAAVAQRGRNKVLLVEADLRRPSWCSALGLDPVPGLAECCASNDPICGFAYRVRGLDLALLPAGACPASRAELLPSRRMSQLMAETSRIFDWVLVDSAPLLPVADSVVVSRLCDGILLVVRRHRALKSALHEALNRIEASKLLGFVLNDFPGHHSCEAYFRSFSEPLTQTLAEEVNSREAA